MQWPSLTVMDYLLQINQPINQGLWAQNVPTWVRYKRRRSRGGRLAFPFPVTACHRRRHDARGAMEWLRWPNGMTHNNIANVVQAEERKGRHASCVLQGRLGVSPPSQTTSNHKVVRARRAKSMACASRDSNPSLPLSYMCLEGGNTDHYTIQRGVTPVENC